MTTEIIARPFEAATVTQLTKAGIDPLMARLYAARQIEQADQLSTSLTDLIAPQSLMGMDAAVGLLTDAIMAQSKILIVADFDVDGATSCALVVRALRAFGAAHVDYLVPNRFEYGYGLTPEIVELAALRTPDLIITVDNGISSHAGVQAANELGITVLVTDHHLPAETLPDADAIVNPNQHGDDFPSKHLAGVGVIFYVMMALRKHLDQAGWFDEQNIARPNVAQWLDLVALGTVADVVRLDHNNRILVAQGIARIRRDVCCAGIRALIEVAKRQQATLQSSDLGFALGPRLNAAGRLDDMSVGIECLLTDDSVRAKAIAAQLDTLNVERREIEQKMKDEALEHLDALQFDAVAEAMPLGLCLYQANWHQGVIGILASRIKDQTHRPVIAFADANLDNDHENSGVEMLKGSARSVAGVHIRDVLDVIATLHPDMLTKFGGHAMAAGLSLAKADLERFQAAFDTEVSRHLNQADIKGVIESDGALSGAELSMSMAEQIQKGGPWGQGFPEPIFEGTFELLGRRVLTEKHLKLQLRPCNSDSNSGNDAVLDGIAFNQLDDDWPDNVTQLAIAYRLDINHYRGNSTLQLMIEHIEPLV